ncbi:hypothetical protein BDM02DRAFT_3106404 [Thelephora ganbajun]|uniref:Uncharacterized protein n=1 Tax=Thelephora ganbajun TaxID=370292 RepID=A0ACB6ZXJ1_THEGA|nr:hypothetical protein BDM02DRAFT_3106404 [Thelephora ganbajun]
MANSGIRVYRHAVSLDERRAKFKTNLSPHAGGARKVHVSKNAVVGNPKKSQCYGNWKRSGVIPMP